VASISDPPRLQATHISKRRSIGNKVKAWCTDEENCVLRKFGAVWSTPV